MNQVCHALREEAELARRKLQHLEPALRCGPDPPGAGRPEALHQDHQEADGGLLLPERLVVALSHAIRDRVVEDLLIVVLGRPLHRDELGAARFEQRVAIRVDGV